MTIEFLNDYFVAVVVGICLCIGWIIKKIDFIPNKYIPLIVGVLGVILNIWNAGEITPVIVLGGLFSGLASTGLHELFGKLIDSNSSTEV